MTEAGVILGTAAYMAPEQARGKPVIAEPAPDRDAERPEITLVLNWAAELKQP